MDTRGLVDYHLHTELCGHARGGLEDYVGRALELGLAEVGFCDHFPLLHLKDPTLSMTVEDLPRYLREVEELRGRFSGMLEIRVGIEVDYLPETLQQVSEMLEGLTLDYVMGSVHFLDGWGFDDPRYVDGYRGRDIRALWERYFQLLGDAAESGKFDVMAHPDYFRRHLHHTHPEPLTLEDYGPILFEAIDSMASYGVGVEVNTSGYRHGIGDCYPSLEVLRAFKDGGIETVTIGSDSHRVEDLGSGLEEAVARLRSASYDHISIFEGRRNHFVSLDEACRPRKPQIRFST